MNRFSHFLTVPFLLGITLSAISCLKQEWDSPPDKRSHDPLLPVNTSIAELQDMPRGIPLTEEIIIAGVIIMDDKSGNCFRKIILQDSTGGLAISIDQNNLYQDYPTGRKIYVRCKGLALDLHDENPHLGYAPDATGRVAAIPYMMTDAFIVKASYPHAVIPDTLTIAELVSATAGTSYLNTLIALKDVEFTDSSMGIPYADPATGASATNRFIEDCSGISIALNSSGYARFQSVQTPMGKGIIKAVYARRGSRPQLLIRDTNDIQFHSERCGEISGVLITIDSLRKQFVEGSERVLHGIKIRGIVISDLQHGNVSSGNIVLQGGNNDKGIVCYYAGEHNYVLGDSLELELEGCVLKSFHDKLELSGISSAQTTILAHNRNILPRNVTIAELVSDRSFESTLVSIHNVSWIGNVTTYNGSSGNLSLTDGTGNLKHFCATMATFKDDTLPPGPVTSLTGYIDIFNGAVQIRMRNPGPPVNDIVP